MDIEDLTVKQIRELAALVPCKRKIKSHSFEIGKAYFVRTVTLYYTGRLVAITASDLVLEDAAWVASTKRWNVTLTTGELDEVEPFPGRVIIGRGAIIDATKWAHALPAVAK